MTKAAKKGAEPRVADQIIQGLAEALEFARGEPTGARVDRVLVTSRHAAATPAPLFTRDRIIDLRTNRMRLSQDVFASALNVSRETVRAWEQGKNTPGGPALRLLEIADEHPDVILERVQVKASGETGKHEPTRPKPGLFHGGALFHSGRPKAIAAKRDPRTPVTGRFEGSRVFGKAAKKK